MRSLDIQHGRLLQVMGSPQFSRGLWLAAACVEIDQPESCVPLGKFVDPTIAANGDFDFVVKPLALWLRARLSEAFDYRPIHLRTGDAAF